MHLAHVDRLIDCLTAAAAFAGMLADTAGGRRQRVVHDDRLERVRQTVFLVQLQEARNVHVKRTTVLARCECQILANTGAATLRSDVVLEFMAKMAQRGKDGVRGGLAEPAERRVADHPSQFVQFVEVLLTTLAFGDARESAQGLVQSHPARRAFAAGFRAGELDEIAGDIDHAVVVVHHHHAARTHDRTEFSQRFEINRRIEHIVRNAAAGRSAGLHRLDVVAGHAATTRIVDELAERGAERHFNQTGVHHLADEGEDLGSGTGLAADLGEPRRTFGNDGRDIEPGLDIVDVGRMAPQAFLRGIRRTRTRAAGLSFQRTDESGLFAANESAGSLDQFDVEVETAPHDVLAQDAVVPGLRDGQIEPMDRQRIFGADIDDPMGGTGDVAADRHAFQQRVGIALQLVAVHVGARIALIGVADQVLPIADGLSADIQISGRSKSPRHRGLATWPA